MRSIDYTPIYMMGNMQKMEINNKIAIGGEKRRLYLKVVVENKEGQDPLEQDEIL